MSTVGSEASRRRTFAIISHPDAGKTTLTEKLLLYAGAIEEAGAVKARAGRQRDVTSDWMEMERQRGISITSTVLQLHYRDRVLNLLDTPGHRDFSEDTYRVLSAVDSAVIVLDAAKGIESQTLKLFQVARHRRIPLLTFVNKFDRPGMEPLEILDQIEDQLGLTPTPVTWPVGAGADFVGVVDRRDDTMWRFERTAHGAGAGAEQALPVGDLSTLGQDGTRAAAEIALLDAVGSDHAMTGFLDGSATPVFFGSALWNFGVRLLLDAIVDMAPAPQPCPDTSGFRRGLDDGCTGQIFKIQANLDPRHRDRVAYMRICSGRFERGMSLVNHRTSRTLSTKYANQVFGRERDMLHEAFPGDIVGLVNAGDLRIGDTLSEDGKALLPSIPTFTPEHFMIARNLDTDRYKQFRRGVTQLEEEGVIQVLRHRDHGDREPILAAVGPMQYEVASHRLAAEYGARVHLTQAPFNVARRTDRPGAEVLATKRGIDVYHRSDGTPIALFPDVYRLASIARDHPDLMLDSTIIG